MHAPVATETLEFGVGDSPVTPQPPLVPAEAGPLPQLPTATGTGGSVQPVGTRAARPPPRSSPGLTGGGGSRAEGPRRRGSAVAGAGAGPPGRLRRGLPGTRVSPQPRPRPPPSPPPLGSDPPALLPSPERAGRGAAPRQAPARSAAALTATARRSGSGNGCAAPARPLARGATGRRRPGVRSGGGACNTGLSRHRPRHMTRDTTSPAPPAYFPRSQPARPPRLCGEGGHGLPHPP